MQSWIAAGILIYYLGHFNVRPQVLIEGDIEYDDFARYVYGDAINDDSKVDRKYDNVGWADETKAQKNLYSECPQGHRKVVRVDKRAAVFGSERLWPYGVVYYEFDDSITAEKEKVIKAAMQHWEDHTCIRFQPHNKEQDYLSFYNGAGCHTAVGRTGGKQTVSINDECKYMGTIAHELAHAIGFWHEQSRPDRDLYVRILWDNILKGKEHNFNKMAYGSIDSRGITYDYNSIMHYGPYSFTKNESLRTMVPLNSSLKITMGQRSYLSELDIKQANKMYCCLNGGCALNPCIRGYCRETGHPPFFKCNCFLGWYGERCHQNYDKCALNPCLKGKCITDRRNSAGFRCICDAGYTGALCDKNINDCTANSCKNGGECVDGVNSYSCKCTGNYRGKHCEFLSCPKSTFPCNTLGVCVKRSHVCDFNNDCGDWSDETEICGNCSFENGFCGYRNKGEIKWKIGIGQTPSEDTGPQYDHTYQTLIGTYAFIEASYQYNPGAEAILETPVYPASGNNCVFSFSYHMYGRDVGELKIKLLSSIHDSIILWSTSGNTGNIWYTEVLTIGKKFFFKLQFIQSGNLGWKADVAIDDLWFLNCEVNSNVDNCRNHNCVHGQCIDGIDGYICQCYPGYSGNYCNVDSNDCKNNPCGIHGLCMDEVNGYSCICQTGYTGLNCEVRVSYFCGFEEGICSPLRNSLNANFAWSLGTGQTLSKGTGPKYDHTIGNSLGKYLFIEGSSPQVEGNKAILEIGQFAKSKENCILSFYYNMNGKTMGGILINIIYNNKTVKTVWKKMGHQGNTWNLAVVKVGKDDNFIIAIIGIIGSHWESDAAIDDIMLGGDCGLLEDCDDSFCSSQGECVSNPDSSFYCVCYEGFYGENCDKELNKCRDNVCGNHEKCLHLDNGYICQCENGWEGRNCELKRQNDCQNKPCVFGKCVDGVGGFICICDKGYIGMYCDIRTCDPNPCINSGICISQPNGFLCYCQDDYSGRFCQKEAQNLISENRNCSQTCVHGKCDLNSTCICNTKYTGKHCNISNIDKSTSEKNVFSLYFLLLILLFKMI